MPALTACKRALCPEASEPGQAQIKPETGGPHAGAPAAKLPSARGGTPASTTGRAAMTGTGASVGRARAESGPVKKAAKRTAPPPPSSTTPVPCPRCGSEATKFCYYNNYDPQQPRYYCKVRVSATPLRCQIALRSPHAAALSRRGCVRSLRGTAQRRDELQRVAPSSTPPAMRGHAGFGRTLAPPRVTRRTRSDFLHCCAEAPRPSSRAHVSRARGHSLGCAERRRPWPPQQAQRPLTA